MSSKYSNDYFNWLLKPCATLLKRLYWHVIVKKEILFRYLLGLLFYTLDTMLKSTGFFKCSTNNTFDHDVFSLLVISVLVILSNSNCTVVENKQTDKDHIDMNNIEEC